MGVESERKQQGTTREQHHDLGQDCLGQDRYLKQNRWPRRRIWVWLLLLWVGLNGVALIYRIQGSGVAGTWHIAPNPQPVVGEPALVWVALTRNGKELSLEQGNCQMGVYTLPRNQGDEPLLQPTLTPRAVDGYPEAPSAEVVFPGSGQYELELGCVPKAAADFQPFQLTYEVAVMASAVASQPTQTAVPWVGTAAAACGIAMLLHRRR